MNMNKENTFKVIDREGKEIEFSNYSRQKFS